MMVRSACLPDAVILGRLLDGLGGLGLPVTLGAPVLQQKRVAASNHFLPKLPPIARALPTAEEFGPKAAAADTSPPSAEAPMAHELLQDEQVLLQEVAQELRGAHSLERSFGNLCTWLEVRTGARAVFVADAEGLPVSDAAGHDRYVAVASEIAGLLKRLKLVAPDLDQGATLLSLGSGEQLVLIGADTDLGRFSVGVLVKRPLAPVWTMVIQTALCRVARRREITG